MTDLTNQALTMGADRAKIVPSASVQVKPELAALCHPDSCSEYGLAPTCPPHVSGPEGFRLLQDHCQEALILRIEVPEQSLMSDKRTDIFRNLQELVAQLEIKALASGYSRAHGFAGGSCKRLFCHNQPDCAVLSSNKPCRHPHQARPSMSGFGVDLLALMHTCGWPATFIASHDSEDDKGKSWVAGLILLARNGAPLNI